MPFAKAYSGLSNADMKVIDSKIKDFEESYGPVKGSTRNHSGTFLTLYQNLKGINLELR